MLRAAKCAKGCQGLPRQGPSKGCQGLPVPPETLQTFTRASEGFRSATARCGAPCALPATKHRLCLSRVRPLCTGPSEFLGNRYFMHVGPRAGETAGANIARSCVAMCCAGRVGAGAAPQAHSELSALSAEAPPCEAEAQLRILLAAEAGAEELRAELVRTRAELVTERQGAQAELRDVGAELRIEAAQAARRCLGCAWRASSMLCFCREHVWDIFPIELGPLSRG